jgi:hypothetical protein
MAAAAASASASSSGPKRQHVPVFCQRLNDHSNAMPVSDAARTLCDPYRLVRMARSGIVPAPPPSAAARAAALAALTPEEARLQSVEDALAPFHLPRYYKPRVPLLEFHAYDPYRLVHLVEQGFSGLHEPSPRACVSEADLQRPHSGATFTHQEFQQHTDCALKLKHAQRLQLRSPQFEH